MLRMDSVVTLFGKINSLIFLNKIPRIYFSIGVAWVVCWAGSIDVHAKSAESIRVEAFNRLNGLNASMMKSIFRDNDGNIYIGTDNELLIYEGVSWKKMDFPLNRAMIKDFYLSPDQRLFVVCDYGIFQIERENQQSTVRPFCLLTDPELLNPKNMYVTGGGDIWAASETHAFRMDESGEVVEKFKLSDWHERKSYLHSYFFAESDSGQLCLFSYWGSAYVLRGDHFERLEWSAPDELFTLMRVDHNSVLIGTDRGLERCDLSGLEDGRSLSNEIIYNTPYVSDMVRLSNGIYVYATYSQHMYSFKDIGVEISEDIKHLKEGVFRLYADHNDMIWMLSDTQVFRCERNPIDFLSTAGETGFIHPITDQKVMIGIGKDLMGIRLDGTSEVLKHFDVGISCAARAKNGDVVISFEDAELLILDPNLETRCRLKTPAKSTYLFWDNGSIWGNLDSADGCFEVGAEGRLTVYGEEQIPVQVTCIRRGSGDRLLVSAIDYDAYLFELDRGKDRFVNVSIPLGLMVADQDTFAVNDFCIDSEGDLYLGTTLGIFNISGPEAQLLDFGKSSNLEYKAIAVDPVDGSLWGASYEGVIHLSNDGGRLIDQFDSFSGLKGGIFTYRDFLVSEEYVWLGVEKGVAVIHKNISKKQTEPCQVEQIIMDGRVLNDMPSKVSDRSSLVLQFRSPNYPPNTLQFQFLLRHEESGEVIEQTQNLTGIFTPNDLPYGDLEIVVTALRHGNYSLSKPMVFPFQVYRSSLRIGAMVSVATIVILLLAIAMQVHRQKKQKKIIEVLDGLVSSRTAELQAKNDDLTQSNRVRDKLFSIIAHDLRGPIGSISLLLGFVSEADTDSEEFKNLIGMMRSETDGTYTLLENLLSWATAQQGSITANMTAVDLNLVVRNMLSVYESRWVQKRIQFSHELDEETVLADQDCLETVLRNLISNATKFCRSGDHIKVISRRDGDAVIVSVVDSGPGIDEATQKRILDHQSFFTTKGSDGESGNGLGISVCCEMLEIMDSHLELESAPDKGTRFYFTLKAPE